MIKGISKFDSEIFYGDCQNWAGFNKQKYTKEEAVESWKNEVFGEDLPYVIEDCFVRHRAGSFEGETSVGWWLEWEEYKTSVPAWSVRKREEWEEEE
jgi:hypothetical protein